MRTEDIATEVFFFPPPLTPRRTARSPTRSGWCSGTTRRSSRRRAAQRPVVHLPPRSPHPRDVSPARSDEMDRPVLDLTWDYPTDGRASRSRAPTAVLAEINGWDATGAMLSAYTQLRDDGSTSCGCWIYCGCYADGVNQTARRKPGARAELDRRRVGVGVARKSPHPLQPRVGGSRGTAVERAQGARLVGRRAGPLGRPRHAGLRGRQAARLPAAGRTPAAPRRSPATTRSSCRPTAAAGSTPPPASPTGRCRPTTSRRTRRCATALYRQQRNPARQVYEHPEQPLPPRPRCAGSRRLPLRRSRPTA